MSNVIGSTGSSRGTIVAAACLLLCLVSGAPPTPCADQPAELVPRVSLQFEGSADESQGRVATRSENLEFAPGKEGQGLLVLAGSKTLLACPTKEWFNPKRGAVELWFRPRWGGDDKELRWLLTDSDGRWRLVKDQWGAIVFVVDHSGWQPALTLSVDIASWRADEWHRVRAEWDMDGEAVLQVDDRSATVRPSYRGATLVVGGELLLGADHRGSPSADGVFDSVTFFAADRPHVDWAARAAARAEAAKAEQARLRQEGLLALDFGPADLPPRFGFTRVGPADLSRSDGDGGWLKACDRALSRAPAPSLPPPDADPELAWVPEAPLERTLVEGEGVNTFRAYVPKGPTEVWLLTGDLGLVPPAFAVSANGTPAVRSEDTAEFIPRVRTWRFRATVTTGVLDLTFQGKPRFAVCGCVIAPERSRQQAAPIVAAMETELSLLPPEQMRSWEWQEHVEQNPPLRPTPRQQQRGFVFFARDSVAPVYPNTVPLAAEVERAIRAFATPGEYEPLTFGVYPLRKVPRLTADVTDLVAAGGARIGRDAMTLRIARYRVNRTAWAGGLRCRTEPELLERAHPVDVEETALFWLTVHIPTGAKPGVYRGHVTLGTAEAQSAQVPLSLRVLPFSLPEPEQTFGVYYLDPTYGIQMRPDRMEEARRRGLVERLYELRRRDLADMREHGIRTFSIIGPRVVSVGGRTAYDAAATTDLVEAGRAAGVLSRPMPGGTPLLKELDEQLWRVQNKVPTDPGWKLPDRLPGSFRRSYVGGIRTMQELAKTRGWPEILFYPIDEPGNPNARELGKRLCRLIHEVPGARTFVTGIPSPDYLDDEFLRDIDVICFSDAAGVPEDPAQTAGHWYYPNSVTGASGDGPTARFCTGFGFFRSGLAGWMPWRYTAWSGSPDSDLDSAMTDFFLSFPTPAEHVPTIRWEQAREGIDDCRYLTALSEAINLAEKSGRPAAMAAAAAARTDLQQIRASTPTLKQFASGTIAAAEVEGGAALGQGAPFDREEWCAAHCTAIRWRVAQHILRIRATLP